MILCIIAYRLYYQLELLIFIFILKDPKIKGPIFFYEAVFVKEPRHVQKSKGKVIPITGRGGL
jgi:hypothetical protein